MIEMILFGIGMLVITLIIQFYLFKSGKNINFWRGLDLVLIMCILGILSNDIDYLAGILGYVIGDYIGGFVGWHKTNNKK